MANESTPTSENQTTQETNVVQDTPTQAAAPEPAVAEAKETAGEVSGEGSQEQAAAGETGASGEAQGQGTGDGTDKKHKRRRRRKRKGDGADAQATGTEEGQAADASGEEEGDENKGKRGKKPSIAREKPPFAVGEEVMGTVTMVMPEAFMIDVAGKALGIFDRREMTTDSPPPADGEKFIAKVSNDGSRGGLVVLTHDLNRWQKSRETVEKAFQEKTPVEGLITGIIKGGVEVDVEGLRGFAPASHVDLRLGADLHYLLGQRLPFEVVQFAKKGREFVLSRKAQLGEAAKSAREEALKALEPGKVIKGVVRSVTPFGAFVDVGGIDGLVHVSEASHTGASLAEVFKVGEEVDVKVLRIDEKGKVWLSRRAAEHDPWEGAAQKYARGSKHKGKVARLQPFGLFIELEPGIDGLLHASDIVSAKRFSHPNEIYKAGDEIDVVVVQSDVGHRRIGLHPAPKDGESVSGGSRLQLHQSVQCIVEGHEANGIIVRIVGQTGRNAKAFIAAIATGTAKGADLRKSFPMGKQLDAKIIELDPRKGTKLSIKALAHDQERQSFKAYQNQVRQEAKFGTFGDLLAKKGLTK